MGENNRWRPNDRNGEHYYTAAAGGAGGREEERADRYRSMFDRWVGVKRRESERERASVGRENAASLVDMCKARPLLPPPPFLPRPFQIPEARTPPAFLFPPPKQLPPQALVQVPSPSVILRAILYVFL